MSLFNELDVVVKSFNRPDKLLNLVTAWNDLYPDVSLTICDDSNIEMPFSDSVFRKHHIIIIPDKYMGVSYGRNYGIDNTDKKYILFLDDDFVPHKGTNLNKLFALFEMCSDIGLVGGVCGERNPTAVIQGGKLELDDGLCKKTCLYDSFETFKGISYRYCSMTDLFFIAKREVFNDVRWDSDLKIAEHTDFFLQLSKTPWKIVFTPEVQIGHDQTTQYSSNYNTYRYGNFGYFKELSWKKHNIVREIYCDKDGNLQKEWITSYARIDFEPTGIIRPYSSKLDGLALVEVIDSGPNKRQTRVLAVGKKNASLTPGEIVTISTTYNPKEISLGGKYQSSKIYLIETRGKQ